MVLALPVVVQAQFTFTTNNGAITITRYTGDGGGVTIPNTINGLPVTGIASLALAGFSITSITVSSNVVSIEVNAFQSSSLTSITVNSQNPVYSSLNGVLFDKAQTTLIGYPYGKTGSYTVPSTVTGIAVAAFNVSKLANVLIQSNVTSIGPEAFAFCSSLTNITVDPLNPVFRSNGNVLFDFNQTTLIQCPGAMSGNYIVPEGVSTIGDEAFSYCTKLTGISLPASVTSIGRFSFGSCSKLSAITVDAGNAFFISVEGVLFDKNQTTLIAFPGGVTGNYTVPSGVETIESGAFEGSGLSGVILPESLVTIKDYAFYLSRLNTLTIPGNVTTIGTNAFFQYPPVAWLSRVFFRGNAPASTAPVVFGSSVKVYYLPDTTGWDTTFAGRPTALWNPTASIHDLSFGVLTNKFGYTITGTANIPIVVEACTNLASGPWTPLQTCTITNGSIYFGDSTWTNYPSRTYRIRSP